MYKRLKEAREKLKLSQEFVARQMNVSGSAIRAMEAGQRKVTVEELDRFSELYGIRAEELMHGKPSENTQIERFAPAFSELSDADRKEILSLIDFKRTYKDPTQG